MKIMGATILDREKWRIEFRAFAFEKKAVGLLLEQGGKTKLIPMEEEEPNMYRVEVEGMGAELAYKFHLEGEGDYPDPFSHFQPDGVHGFSRVVDHEKYCWRNTEWKGMELAELIFYELHVGTFTPEGTFKGVTGRLDYLLELGINAIELMPVVQTSGRWNWGYDGSSLLVSGTITEPLMNSKNWSINAMVKGSQFFLMLSTIISVLKVIIFPHMDHILPPNI